MLQSQTVTNPKSNKITPLNIELEFVPVPSQQ